MKIAILTNDSEGLYKFRKELLYELLNNNEVFIVLPNGKYITELTEIGCKYIEICFDRKGTNPIKDVKLCKEFISVLRQIKADVVLTYTIKPNIYGGIACQYLHIPYIANITGLGSSIENGGILSIISLFLYKIGLKKAKKVFFQNNFNMDLLISKRIICKKQSDLLPGSGVNLIEYQLLPYLSGDLHFSYIGRIMKEKGFDQFLDMAKTIKKENSNVYFDVYGEYEDDYRKEINYCTKNGIVEYHGSVSDMVEEVYLKTSCVVHPSYYAEGMSNVLLEAMACGRPIITTRRPGCGELVDDGYNGYVVKEKDSNDLIRKVNKFIMLSHDEKIAMGEKGRKKVEKLYDRKIVIKKYLDEINTL